MTEQRHHDLAPIATGASRGAPGFGGAGISLRVGDVDRRAVANGLGVRPFGLKRLWETRPRGGVASVVSARERGELDLIARDLGQRPRSRLDVLVQVEDVVGIDPLLHLA